MISFFYTTLYIPLYNLLVFFTHLIPTGDIGLAVVLVTVLVKLITSPLSMSALRTQRRMRVIEPQLKEVRAKYKDDKEKLARETMALYKNNGIKPFSSILGTLIQLPIIISLYHIFNKGHLIDTDLSLVYHFVPLPETISPLFLGIFTVAGHSITLAILAGIAQFVQAYYSIPIPVLDKNEKSMGAEFGRNIALQARYILPIFIAFIAYTSGAIALFFITSSLFGIAQELYVRRQKHPMMQPVKA